jgi:tetratricopeptide (TPR) repeat protein
MSTKDRAEPAGGAPGAHGRGSPTERLAPFLAALAIALGTLLAYAGTLSCPFILDDVPAIAGNPSIRHIWSALTPPRQLPVSGRPLLNLSYALNYAVGGQGVRGYHAFNLLVHVLCALAVFGIVRRMLSKPPLAGRFGTHRLQIALLVAGLWALHPLNTEAVTYVSERAESLMGLFFLATLYLFARSDGSPRPAAWLAASAAACLLGALTKEVIAAAPLLVLLYDRTFCAGSFAGALRARWRYYAALAAALLPLAFLVPGTGQRGVGFGNGVGPWQYAFISCRSVVLYLKLAFWPHPLVFDYGAAAPPSPSELAPYALAAGALFVLAATALRRWPAAGFACAWFLVILAPTSSFIPLAFQPTAEHRAYLPLAAVVCATVLCAYRILGRWGAIPLAALAVVLGLLTHERNADYGSELSIWSDTVSKRPGNPRAHVNLGVALGRIPGRERDAASEYGEALRLDPGLAEAHNDLGLLMATAFGRFNDAVAQFEAALRSRPDYVEAHDNLGMALSAIPGRLPDAIKEYGEALRLSPGYAKAHNDLGVALGGSPGRLPEAVAQFEEAIRLRPDYTEARNNLETARQLTGQSGAK